MLSSIQVGVAYPKCLTVVCFVYVQVVHCTTMSEEDCISKYAEKYHRGQKLPSTSTMGNRKPWQNLTWNRTQLLATKVEVINTWAGLQQLASCFDL